MFLLDMKTVIFGFVCISFILLLILTWGWIANRKKFAGIGYFLLDFLFKFTGCFLLLSRGSAPAFISILLANLFLGTGSYLFIIGVSRFTGIKIRKYLHFAILTLSFLIFSYFTFINPNIVIRIIIMSVVFIHFCAVSVWLFLFKSDKKNKSLYLAPGLICATYILLSISRIVVALLVPESNDSFFGNTSFDTLLILLSEILGVALTFAIIMMINNRLLSDIRKYSLIREKMMDKLYLLSITDSLTNLFNRKKIEDILNEEMIRSKRYNRPLSIMMVDIDHFKNINDQYGHLVGDEVLKKVSDALTMNIRNVDRIGRWGGEEFLVIAPETDLEDAEILANRLRYAVENLQIDNVRGLTISIGVTLIEDNENIENIIRRTDNALYKAKKFGRNRVEILRMNRIKTQRNGKTKLKHKNLTS